MADLRLLIPASSALVVGAHAKATFQTDAVTLTFPYVDADGDIADLARTWVEQARPGDRKPLTRPGSPKLAKVSLTALFADPNDAQASVETPLRFLLNMAASDRPLVAAFGGLLGDPHLTASGRWVIQTCTVHVQRRAHADNAVTRAAVDVDLLEANVPGWVPIPSTSRYAVTVAGAGTGHPRTVTVGPRESLWAVAVRVYGDGSRWIDLGDANGILNPADLTAGTVLLVP